MVGCLPLDARTAAVNDGTVWIQGFGACGPGVKQKDPHLCGAHPGDATQRDGRILHQAARHHAGRRSQDGHQPLGDGGGKGAQLLGPLLDRQLACGMTAALATHFQPDTTDRTSVYYFNQCPTMAKKQGAPECEGRLPDCHMPGHAL